jgi:CheY-like chemotaxis protein/two-component sensor histidine kinase
MLGHELRNPIAPIRAAVDLWRAQGGQLSTEQRSRSVEVVARQADHLTRLVDELLDVSRVTHGKIELRRETLDLRETIEQSRDALREHSRDHVVELDVPERAVMIDGDPVRLRQVFVNLLDNAVKFTKKGGRIAVQLTSDDSIATVHVRDDGVGIAPDQIERVFTAFAQGEARPLARAKGGLGLGLALVRRLVELHGGSVAAQSDGVGHGADLIVRMPIAAHARPARVVDSVRESAPAEALGLLVVEDNEDGAEMLEELLRAMGHRPSVALDGAAALAAIANARFDAVLLDLGLPDMDGLEVARQMRAHSPGTTLIAITGHGDRATRARVIEDGFAAHLLKPVDAATLRQTLAEHVTSAARGGLAPAHRSS